MKKLFDETTGYLMLDEVIMDAPSFKMIMADNVITDEEIIKQANTVIELLRSLDEKLNSDEKELAVKAITEIAVLYEINARRGE